MEFYAAACQVIPVLFVVMAFEAQVLTKRPSPYFADKDQPRYWNA